MAIFKDASTAASFFLQDDPEVPQVVKPLRGRPYKESLESLEERIR